MKPSIYATEKSRGTIAGGLWRRALKLYEERGTGYIAAIRFALGCAYAAGYSDGHEDQMKMRSSRKTRLQPISLSAAQGVSASPLPGVPAGGYSAAQRGDVPDAPASESPEASAFPKPVREPKTKTRPMPKCICGHAKRLHTCAPGNTDDWCEKCGAECQTYIPSAGRFSRSRPVARKAGGLETWTEGHPESPDPKRAGGVSRPIARKAAPKKARKILPRCVHCAHPESKHWHQGDSLDVMCWRCLACPGYEPARGIRQKRRTPAAAAKLLADGLWSKLVHARPGACEIQEYHRHVCDGGFQAMHGIPRTFGATRHLLINGFKGCADAHMFFTKRPEAWSAVLLEAWGLETFRELWALARASKPVDMDATVASLRAEAAARGIQ